MSGLTDMEELLLSIEKIEIKKYMEEAFKCYMAGAYRGCIVLSYIALFDDLVEKLGELSYVNSEARKIYNEVTKRIDMQDVYENYLVDQLRSKNILTELECTSLKIIKEKRNKSAHPSGHKPSAEEARYIFYEVITNFLSKEKLITTQLVDELLLRLNNKYFFPTKNIGEAIKIVKQEIKDLHPEAYTYLVINLIKKIKHNDDQDIVTRNASGFLISLSSLTENQKMQEIIKAKFIIKKLDDEKFSSYIIGCISYNPSVILELDDIAITRLKKIMTDNIENGSNEIPKGKVYHPAWYLRYVIEELKIEKTIEILEEEILLFMDLYPFDINVFERLLNNENMYQSYKEILTRKASSGNFDIANNFVDQVVDIESKLIKYLKPIDSLEIIICIISAARHGAYSSKYMLDNEFRDISSIKKAAKDFCIESNKEKINELINNYLFNYDYEKVRDLLNKKDS